MCGCRVPSVTSRVRQAGMSVEKHLFQNKIVFPRSHPWFVKVVHLEEDFWHWLLNRYPVTN